MYLNYFLLDPRNIWVVIKYSDEAAVKGKRNLRTIRYKDRTIWKEIKIGKTKIQAGDTE